MCVCMCGVDGWNQIDKNNKTIVQLPSVDCLGIPSIGNIFSGTLLPGTFFHGDFFPQTFFPADFFSGSFCNAQQIHFLNLLV